MEEQSRPAWEGISAAMQKAGLSDEQRSKHRPAIVLDLSRHWTEAEQAQWEDNVTRGMADLIGKRNIKLSSLIKESDWYVRQLTDTLKTRTLAANRDASGTPAKKQCSNRKTRGTRLDWEWEDGDEEDDDAEEDDDSSRKRR